MPVAFVNFMEIIGRFVVGKITSPKKGISENRYGAGAVGYIIRYRLLVYL
jgi:hypothetical protein